MKQSKLSSTILVDAPSISTMPIFGLFDAPSIPTMPIFGLFNVADQFCSLVQVFFLHYLLLSLLCHVTELLGAEDQSSLVNMPLKIEFISQQIFFFFFFSCKIFKFLRFCLSSFLYGPRVERVLSLK